MKYIDAEKLYEEIEKKITEKEKELKSFSDEDYVCSVASDIACRKRGYLDIIELLDSLQQEQTDMGEVSDGYHTFNELYYYRMLYNAAFFNLLPKEWVHKSKKHHDGEDCFGGGWFIVMAQLPTGQISNHYELKYWDLFEIPEKEFADEWDGHTPQEAAERLYKYLQQEQTEKPTKKNCNNCPHCIGIKDQIGWYFRGCFGGQYKGKPIAEIDECPLNQEQPDVDLEQNIEMEWDSFNKHLAKYDEESEEVVWLNRFSFVDIVNYFYELGLKAKK